jgi:hypothetical protein
VCRCCQPGRDAQPDVDQKRAAYRDATQEIVQPIAGQDEVGQGGLAVCGGVVTVVPVQELLESEEGREPQHQPNERRKWRSRRLQR